MLFSRQKIEKYIKQVTENPQSYRWNLKVILPLIKKSEYDERLDTALQKIDAPELMELKKIIAQQKAALASRRKFVIGIAGLAGLATISKLKTLIDLGEEPPQFLLAGFLQKGYIVDFGSTAKDQPDLLFEKVENGFGFFKTKKGTEYFMVLPEGNSGTALIPFIRGTPPANKQLLKQYQPEVIPSQGKPKNLARAYKNFLLQLVTSEFKGITEKCDLKITAEITGGKYEIRNGIGTILLSKEGIEFFGKTSSVAVHELAHHFSFTGNVDTNKFKKIYSLLDRRTKRIILEALEHEVYKEYSEEALWHERVANLAQIAFENSSELPQEAMDFLSEFFVCEKFPGIDRYRLHLINFE